MAVSLLKPLIDPKMVVATRHVKAYLSLVSTGGIQAMRLLHVNTRQLEEFFGDSIPEYAILSHTWGKDEVSLQDLSREGHQQKQGYAKIEGCCQQAIKDGLSWVWVDTCCIDKTSSAELSEAINSMFRWYQHSIECYAYLQDVPSGTDVYEQNSAFRKSRWFTRGWTLQELLAPRKVKFYDTNWTYIFLRDTFSYGDIRNDSDERSVSLLSDITSIDRDVLSAYLVFDYFLSVSAGCIFSWMAKRSTTRVEDQAYCLLGLLNINMPLLYGEGTKAFIRLQQAILSSSDDISLLASGYHSPYTHGQSCLARSPAEFLGYPKGYATLNGRMQRTHTTVTGRGLHIELPMILINEQRKVWLGIVEEEETSGRTGIAIVLEQIWEGNLFKRVSGCPPVSIRTRNLSRRTKWAMRSKQIYIAHDSEHRVYTRNVSTRTTSGRLLSCVQFGSRTSVPELHDYRVAIVFLPETGYSFSSLWPPAKEYWLPGAFDRVEFAPHSKLFYMIFSNDKQDRFAVRIEVESSKGSSKLVKTAFCALTGQYLHTALEHCCGTKIGSKIPQFVEDMHWSPYFAAKNVTTNESGYVHAVEMGLSSGGGIARTVLVWERGLYSEGRPVSGES